MFSPLKKLNLKNYLSVTISVLVSFFFVAVTVYSATTISNNITTGNLTVTGTMGVTGASTLTGALLASSTVQVSGPVSLFDTLSVTNGVSASGSLMVTGLSKFAGGFITQASSSVGSTLTVGSPGTALSGLVMGFCTIADTTVTASSTDGQSLAGFASAGISCSGATGVQVGDRIFVMATGSLPSHMRIAAASSTAAGAINVMIVNMATSTKTQATGINSFNFWAVR